MWKSIQQQYENSKLKIMAPMCYDEFELPDGSYSVSYIQDYIKYIIRKHKTLTTDHPVHIYTNKIIIRNKNCTNMNLLSLPRNEHENAQKWSFCVLRAT